jgi:hypothetical protein
MSFFTRLRNNPKHFLLLALTSPLIYGLIVPFVIADICGSLYQAVCFRVYRIPRVKRSDHIIYDRAKLAYLTPFQKLNCLYCEYANGVIAYVGEITARTEWYWCPIKHQSAPVHPHEHYDRFLGYQEEKDFRKKLKEVRTACRACETSHERPPHT